jgi:hypothetical protein
MQFKQVDNLVVEQTGSFGDLRIKVVPDGRCLCDRLHSLCLIEIPRYGDGDWKRVMAGG